MKTSQANLLNSLPLILRQLKLFLRLMRHPKKPEQSITYFIPLFLGVIYYYVIKE